jgi:gluconolactonase
MGHQRQLMIHGTAAWIAFALALAPQPKPADEVRLNNDSIERSTAEFDDLVPSGARIEVLATGFGWSEGPVWIRQGGYLLFSDVPANRIHR